VSDVETTRSRAVPVGDGGGATGTHLLGPKHLVVELLHHRGELLLQVVDRGDVHGRCSVRWTIWRLRAACRAFSATNHFAFSNETLNPFGGPYDHLVW
jgi:hypothetical protein